jgi:tripartite-type tricarboxylate transporter receptor subunit TctC
VIAGHVPTMFSVLGDALPHIASGSIRGLAVSSEVRSVHLPDVPTVAETGYPGFRANSWNGLMAPARVPKAIVDRIAAEVGRIVKDQKFVAQTRNIGVDVVGNGPEEFSKMIAADMALWPDALRVAGIKKE